MNIVNLSPAAILHIAEAATRADCKGQRFRLAFDTTGTNSGAVGYVCYKVGEGMWSAPFYDDMASDPYRG